MAYMSIYAQNVKSYGDILLSPQSTNDSNIYINDVENISIDMDSLTFDTLNAKATANFARDSVTTANVNKVSFSGANTGTLALSSSESAHIGEVNVTSYVDAEGATKNSANNWINLAGAGVATIDTINLDGYIDNHSIPDLPRRIEEQR